VSTKYPEIALRRLLSAIDAVSGLHTVADLARRWGISKARADELAQHGDFPDPVIRVGKSDIYTGIQADEFRATTRKPGRPKR
jgi:hypothetical protein